ncbi:MAG: class I SAM-dependent methyltransferase [Gammaproteobacteria bacterium]|nr:class I SAM-dependent methyltransferase [Gammaproteobacteria bacterium]
MDQLTHVCPVCGGGEHAPFGSKNGYNLFKCSACEMVFVNPMPDDTDLNRFYQNYHKTSQYTGKLESKQRRARRRIKKIAKYTPGKLFVDIGCNAGFAVEAARNLGLDAYGIDVDENSIRCAREIYPQASFDAMSVQDLAASGKSFDIIYCSEVIEHLSKVDDFVDSLHKILKDDGVLFLTTPDISHFSVIKDPLIWDAVRPPEHLLYFSKNSLEKLLKSHGFSRARSSWNFKPTLKMVVRK